MKGIQGISARILSDAKNEAQRIMEEAQEKARSLKEKKVQETEKHNAKLYKEAQNKARERMSRMVAAAELDMRKNILAAKQDIIDETMEKVKEDIMSIPKDKYRKIISNMLLESAQGDEEVIFSTVDLDRLDQSLVDEVNELLKSQGKKGKLRLSPQREDFDGGFILRSGGLEINNTFGAIIRMSREHMESELAEILFEKEG